jgi:hypothetical protein
MRVSNFVEINQLVCQGTNGGRFDFLTFAGINHPWHENHASTIQALFTVSFFVATQEIRSSLKTAIGTGFICFCSMPLRSSIAVFTVSAS